jgi:hypothetical protein
MLVSTIAKASATQNRMANCALVAWYQKLHDQVIVDVAADASWLTIMADNPSDAAEGPLNCIIALCTDAMPKDKAGVRIQHCTWRTLMGSQRRFHMCVALIILCFLMN